MIKIQNTFKANGCLCPKSDTVICHNCHILAPTNVSIANACKIISQLNIFSDSLRNLLIIKYLQSPNFKLRKLGLCLLQTLTLQYLNSHFGLSKVRVCSIANNLRKDFSKRLTITKNNPVTVVTFVTTTGKLF